MVLSKGRVTYFGTSQGLLPHMLNLGYRLPLFKSWTEMIEEISGQPDLFFEPEHALQGSLDLEGITVDTKDIVQHRPAEATAVLSPQDALEFSATVFLASSDAAAIDGKLTSLDVVPPPSADRISLVIL